MNRSSLSGEYMKNKQKLEFVKINIDTFNQYRNKTLPKEKPQNNKINGSDINPNQENPNSRSEKAKKKIDPQLNNDINNKNNNNFFSRSYSFQKQQDNANQKQQQAPRKSQLDLLLEQRKKEFHDIKKEDKCDPSNYAIKSVKYDFLDDYPKGPVNPNSQLLTMFEYIQENYLTSNKSLLKVNLQKQELKQGNKQSKSRQYFFEQDFETHQEMSKLQYYEIKLSKVASKTDFSGFIMEQTRQLNVPKNQILNTVMFTILKQKLSEVTKDVSTRFILNQLKNISPETQTLENKLLRLIYLAFYTAALLATSDKEYNDTAKQLVYELFKYQIVLNLFFKRAINQVTDKCKDKSKLEIILEQENKEYKRHDLLINEFANIYRVNIILFDKFNKYERNCFLQSKDISTIYVFSKQKKSDKNISVAVTFDITDQFYYWFYERFYLEKQQGEPVQKY